MFGKQIKWIIYISIVILCVSCTVEKPPLEFAPSPSIIEKALTFKVEYEQKSLSRQLTEKKLNFTITEINIKKIEPIILFDLPTYHLEGNYKIKFSKNSHQNTSVTNTFNLDLQRQSTGKTWRILLKSKDKKSVKYSSYLIY